MIGRYLIGSSFHRTPKPEPWAFAPVWEQNTLAALDAEPGDDPAFPFVIVTGQHWQPAMPYSPGVIRQGVADGDLGSHVDLLTRKKTHAYNGWSGAMLACLAMAYNAERDLIFKEQDCLAFGPWISQLYQDIGQAGLLFGTYGHGWTTGPDKPPMPCAQSLFLCRHWFIPVLIGNYFSSPAQDRGDQLGESKFTMIESRYGALVRRFLWGYDRWRPVPVEAITDEVFYLQQVTAREVSVLQKRGLLRPTNHEHATAEEPR